MTTETVNPYPAVAPVGGNPAGRASLVIAIVIVVVNLAQLVVSHLIPLIMRGIGFGVSMVGVTFGVIGAVLGILALAGLILGIIGLGRPVARAAAGAGTAIAASTLLSVVINFVLPFIIDALY